MRQNDDDGDGDSADDANDGVDDNDDDDDSNVWVYLRYISHSDTCADRNALAPVASKHSHMYK